MTDTFYLHDGIYKSHDVEIEQKLDIVFSLPRFSHLKMWNFPSGWVRNREGLGPRISQASAVTSKQERRATFLS